MYGLTVRWSLMDSPPGTDQALRDHVRDCSVGQSSGLPGLVLTTWQMAERGSFSGLYVWSSPEARAGFLEELRATPSPVTQLVGRGPDVIEEWELVGVAVGADGPLRA